MDNNNGYNPNNNYDPNAVNNNAYQAPGYDPNAAMPPQAPGYDPNAAAGYNAYQAPGYNPNQYNPYNPYGGGEDQNSKIMAMISLGAGILSIIFVWINGVAWLSLLFGIAGIVLSAITMKKLTSSKGFAIGGLVTSIIGLLIWVVLIAIACCVAATILNSGYYVY